MSLVVKQSSERVGTNSWKWSVWLDGSELGDVEEVEYILHSTFKNPIQTKRNKESQFRFDGRGWGEFLVRMNVKMENGDIRPMSHHLEFEGKDYGEFAGVPRVLITYAISDAQHANRLCPILMREGIVAVAMEAVTDFSRDLDRFNGLVVVLPKRMSPWLSREIHAAVKANVKVFLIGNPSQSSLPLPPDVKYYELNTDESKVQFARAVAETLKAE